MIIRVPDLDEEVRQLEFLSPAGAVNARIAAGPGPRDQSFARDLAVAAEIYRSERDVHFQGRVEGVVTATCARCLDDFERPLGRDFRFVILPRPRVDDDSDDDDGVDHYSGEEVDLGPLVAEQALLALDPIPVCSPDCRGLCPGCGEKVGSDQCRCSESDRPGAGRTRHLFSV